MTPLNGRSGNTMARRLLALEARVGDQRPTWTRWVWRDGHAHNVASGEVYTAEERAQAYRDQNVRFIDRVIVRARDGRPCGLASDGQSAEGLSA